MPLVRPPRVARALALAATVPLLACGEPTAVVIPERLGPPDFEGVLRAGYEARPQQWLVERAGASDACEDRVAVTIDGGTEIRRADGTRGRPAELSAGRPVSVWFGPVMLRSCPGQTTAVAIVLR